MKALGVALTSTPAAPQPVADRWEASDAVHAGWLTLQLPPTPNPKTAAHLKCGPSSTQLQQGRTLPSAQGHSRPAKLQAMGYKARFYEPATGGHSCGKITANRLPFWRSASPSSDAQLAGSGESPQVARFHRRRLGSCCIAPTGDNGGAHTTPRRRPSPSPARR